MSRVVPQPNSELSRTHYVIFGQLFQEDRQLAARLRLLVGRIALRPRLVVQMQQFAAVAAPTRGPGLSAGKRRLPVTTLPAHLLVRRQPALLILWCISDEIEYNGRRRFSMPVATRATTIRGASRWDRPPPRLWSAAACGGYCHVFDRPIRSQGEHHEERCEARFGWSFDNSFRCTSCLLGKLPAGSVNEPAERCPGHDG